jgi:hypothetical protein
LAGTGIVVILRRKAVRKMIGRIEIMCLSGSDQRRVRQKEYREIKLVRRIHVIVLFGLAAALAGFGCDQQIQQQPSQVNETKTSEQGPILPGKTGSEKGQGFFSGAGKVLETIDAAGYTYVKMNMDGKIVWAATSQVSFQQGEEVFVPEGMPMYNFRSKSLSRTFDVVYFVPFITRKGQAPPKMNDPMMEHPPFGRNSTSTVSMDFSGVTKVQGGYTIEEIFQTKASLSGKKIAVRGKVVKFSSGIMDKNWIHLRDGTGLEGTNDLTVTTNAEVSVGDIVVARGILTTDKDFGYGYKYSVIIEDAEILTLTTKVR